MENRDPPHDQNAEVERLFKAIRPYKPDAYGGAILKPLPKDGEEWGRMHRTESESKNSGHVTLAGIAVLLIVTVFACCAMIGLTYYDPAKSHEDAVRIILLIVGGVIGALYGTSRNRN